MAVLHDIFIGNYPLTQNFGVNYNNYKWILDYKGRPIKGHNGLDYGCPDGTILLNPFPKTSEVVVSFVGNDPKGYGNFLRIWDKTQKCVVLYAHCQKILVKTGDKLYFQQAVALSNNTGWSTGSHLHFGFYEVDGEGNKLNRDNGFDGFLHPLSAVIKWEILNPTKPADPPQPVDPLKECLSQHTQLVSLLDQRNKEISNLKRLYETLQAEMTKKLTDKDKECQQKLQAFKQKVLDFVNNLSV